MCVPVPTKPLPVCLKVPWESFKAPGSTLTPFYWRGKIGILRFFFAKYDIVFGQQPEMADREKNRFPPMTNVRSSTHQTLARLFESSLGEF